MGRKIRLSVRLSLETPEDVAILSALSTVPPGGRTRWLRTRILVGWSGPDASPLPEPTGRGRLLRVDLYDDTPAERELIARARRDFYPGQTLRACLLRGGRGNPALPGSQSPFGEKESSAGRESANPPSPGSVKERLRGLL